MPCPKASLQPFVDWLLASRHPAFVHIVTAKVDIPAIPGRGGDLGSAAATYTGTVTYVPNLTRHRPGRGPAPADRPDLLLGNLIDTTNVSAHLSFSIAVTDPISFSLLQFIGRNAVGSFDLISRNCAANDDSLVISAARSDGGPEGTVPFSVTLTRTEFVVIPIATHH